MLVLIGSTGLHWLSRAVTGSCSWELNWSIVAVMRSLVACNFSYGKREGREGRGGEGRGGEGRGGGRSE